MDTFCIHNARKMRTNFSLVYVSPCTFKCPIKITRQSSSSCDAGSHRCADETARKHAGEHRAGNNMATPSTAAYPRPA